MVNARFLVLIALAALLAGCAGDMAFKKGERSEVDGDYDRAVIYYRQALQEDPENISFMTRLARAQEKATVMHMERADRYIREKNPDVAIFEAQQAQLYTPRSEKARQLLDEGRRQKDIQTRYIVGQNYYAAGRPNEALTEFNKILEVDPDNKEAKDFAERITRQKLEINPGEEGLNLVSDQPVSLSFKEAKLKEVFEFLSKLSGVTILFDEDVKDAPVTVYAKDVTFTQALNLLLATNKLFMKRIAPDAVIVIPKTKTKLDQYQDLLMKTYYMSHISAKEMVNIIRSMLETRRIIINDSLNAITLRETPDKLKLAEKLIELNDRKDSEVVIDVEVLSVDRGPDTLTYGIGLPQSVTGTWLPGGAAVVPSAVDFTKNVVTNASRLEKGGSHANNNLWFSYPSVTANWGETKSKAETLTNPQIRTLNHKAAKILIGSRIPVQTGVTVAGAQTTATFEYRDVGIKLTVEPTIGIANDVEMKTTLEVSALLSKAVSVGGSSQPGFTTTTAETTLNLRDGETVVIGGLLENVTNDSINGVAGLMDVPILGKIFSTNTIGENRKRELIMSLTPHIVRGQDIPARDVTAFWSGTEENFDIRPLFEQRTEKLSVAEPEEGGEAEGKPLPGKAAPSKEPVEHLTPITPATATTRKIGRVGTVSFAPEIVPVDVGQEITVDVMAADLDSVFEAPLSIIYNPKLVQFIKATEGDFMNVDKKPTSFTASANDKVGYIDVFLTRLGKVPGISGSGKLFSLTFKAAAPGISPLVFKQNTLRDMNRQVVRADLKTGTLYVK